MSETKVLEPGIQSASLEDFAELRQMLDMANAYSLTLSGRPMWTNMQHALDGFYSYVQNGKCYVIRNEHGEITSTISISNETDDSWGARGNDDQALYITKLMKDPVKAKTGEGKKLLELAALQAHSMTKPYVRCDIVAEPELAGLANYYYKFGFAEKGQFIYAASGRPGLLLEARTDRLLELINAKEH